MEMPPVIQAKDSDPQQYLFSLCFYFSFLTAEEKYKPLDM